MRVQRSDAAQGPGETLEVFPIRTARSVRTGDMTRDFRVRSGTKKMWIVRDGNPGERGYASAVAQFQFNGLTLIPALLAHIELL